MNNAVFVHTICASSTLSRSDLTASAGGRLVKNYLLLRIYTVWKGSSKEYIRWGIITLLVGTFCSFEQVPSTQDKIWHNGANPDRWAALGSFLWSDQWYVAWHVWVVWLEKIFTPHTQVMEQLLLDPQSIRGYVQELWTNWIWPEKARQILFVITSQKWIAKCLS